MIVEDFEAGNVLSRNITKSIIYHTTRTSLAIEKIESQRENLQFKPLMYFFAILIFALVYDFDLYDVYVM